MTHQRLRLLLGIVGLLPCLACLDSPSAGERTSTGMCPTGEVCSTTTSGLFFVGTFDEGDGGPRHIGSVVVGGIENVRLFAGADRDTATPFTSEVTVVSDTPSVLAVERPGAAIVLRGVAPGSALLRVLEVGTGRLLDRVTVNVIAFDGVALIGTPFDALVDQGSFGTAHYTGPFAMLSGRQLDAHVTLDGGVTDCGVDAALRVTDRSGFTLVDGSAGAPYRVSLIASGVTPIALHVHAAGVDTDLGVPVVHAIDGVAISTHTISNALGAPQRNVVCAVGTAAGVPVVGASPPTFTTLGVVTLSTTTGAFCAGITLEGGRRATITATVDGHAASEDVVGPL